MLTFLARFGRILQIVMIAAFLMLFAMGAASHGDPEKLGRLTGQLFLPVLLLELLVRGARPANPEQPTAGNYLAGGCLGLWLGAVGLAFVGGFMAGMSPRLTMHQGRSNAYQVKVPSGVVVKPQDRTDPSPLGPVVTTGEHWDRRGEGGALGMVTFPPGLENFAEHAAEIPAAFVQRMGGVVQATRQVKVSGLPGSITTFVITAKKGKGEALFVNAPNRIYFCMYIADQGGFQQSRADEILNSFQVTSVK